MARDKSNETRNHKGNVIKKVKKKKYPDTHKTPKRRVPKSTANVAKEAEKWRKEYNKPGAKSIWLANSKRTKEVIFSSPEILLEEFLDYVQFCKDNPWVRQRVVISGKKGTEISNEPIEKPVTLGGFMVFCGVGDRYWQNFVQEIAPRDENYGSVIDFIKKATREQNIDGAAVGIYNANIISRLHGLADNINTNITDDRQKVADVFPKKLKEGTKKR